MTKRCDESSPPLLTCGVSRFVRGGEAIGGAQLGSQATTQPSRMELWSIRARPCPLRSRGLALLAEATVASSAGIDRLFGLFDCWDACWRGASRDRVWDASWR